MTDWAPVFLGVIALATLVMAAIQVAAIIYGARAAQRLEQRLGRFEADLKPVLERARQAERLDRVLGEMVERVDETLAAAQEFVTGPARQGMAIMAGVKAVLDAFRSVREASRRRAAPRPVVDEEESLFIG